MFCPKCGKEVKETDAYCPSCGANLNNQGTPVSNPNVVYQNNVNSSNTDKSPLSRGLATIFCAIGFIGIAGIHRFYSNKVGTGILWLLTGGVFGIGTLIDFIMILCGSFTDSNGQVITDWNID
ncbi:MAG: NINE protein [Bacilli bacterium]